MGCAPGIVASRCGSNEALRSMVGCPPRTWQVKQQPAEQRGVCNMINTRLSAAVRLLLAMSAAAAQLSIAETLDAASQAQDGTAEDASAGDKVLEKVVVEARQKSAASEVVRERMEAPVVVDLLQAEQISKVGDSTVALALRRLPGVSLVGNFVYVRSLGERYSSTTVNGAYVPSPDLTRNVIPLDFFPTEIIESISIQKGYTVDRPAAFGGGNVDIRTRHVPQDFEFLFQFGTGWNSDNSDDVLTYPGGGDDELGKDDGTRALPSEINEALQTYRGSVNPSAIFEGLQRDGGSPTFADAEAINRSLATTLNRSIDFNSESPHPDLSAQTSIGNSWTLDEAGNWNLGVLALVDYQNVWRNRDRTNRSAQLPDLDHATTKRSINTVALTGSLSAGVEFTRDQKLGLTGMYLRNTDDEAALTLRNNFNFRREEGAQLRDYRVRYQERVLELWQINGQHTLGDDTLDLIFGGRDPGPLLKDLQFSWYYSDAEATTEIPNEMTVAAVDAIDPATGALLQTSVRANASAADFRFTDLSDEVHSYGWQLTRPFAFGDGTVTGKVFGGWDYHEKGRSYVQKEFALGTTHSAAAPILVGTPADVFTDENILDPLNGFALTIGGIGTESYLAGEIVDAGYGGFDVNWNKVWRFTGGVRYEDWVQESVPVDPLQFDTGVGKIPIPIEDLPSTAKQVDDWYPSLGVTYLRSDFWADDFQLRFGFSQTTARPDLREVTQSAYIDPFTQARVIGNPLLVPSDLTNYDIRADWFFANGNSLTVSPFYKVIDNPIETVEGAGTDNNLSFTFINADKADLYGLEVEWFADLGFTSRWLGSWASGLFTAGNATWTDSELTIGTSSFALTNDRRPLNQQSDLILNLQLGYDSPGGGHSAVLVYNGFSERLFYAGRNGAPDAYEQPFNSLDFIYSWYPAAGWELKLRLQNLLNDSIEIKQGNVVVLEQDLGTTFKLDATIKF
jgi:TonB-dependent receptor